jgi:hypothetical protein
LMLPIRDFSRSKSLIVLVLLILEQLAACCVPPPKGPGFWRAVWWLDCSKTVVRTTTQEWLASQQGISPAPAGISASKVRTRQMLVRLIEWMKSGVPVAFVAILGIVLSMGAVVCPLWMISLSQDELPCSHHTDSPDQCVSASIPLLVEHAAEVVDSTVIWSSLRNANPVRAVDGSPPGPDRSLFLRTHSLLI